MLMALFLLLGTASVDPGPAWADSGAAHFNRDSDGREPREVIGDANQLFFELIIITIWRPSIRGNCSTVISLARSASTRFSMAVPSS